MITEKLINEIALNAGIARADAEHVLQIITDTIIDSISNGEKVELNGFGSFYSKPLNASQCADINVLAFKQSNALRVAVN
ncbi:MAG: integration host factor subunit alpha [Candidatus Thioglobus sp.]|nr:MAG: integration host factor subunit alpha [Candidatus Thioglobus sp.]